MATQSITFCVPHGESFANARAAAASIYALLERVPGIDALMEGGLAPRRVLGDIQIDDVHFSYPSRPDVKVKLFGPLIILLRIILLSCSFLCRDRFYYYSK